MERAIPILPADDLSIARELYVERLGFQVRFQATEDGKTGLLGLERPRRARAGAASAKSVGLP